MPHHRGNRAQRKARREARRNEEQMGRDRRNAALLRLGVPKLTLKALTNKQLDQELTRIAGHVAWGNLRGRLRTAPRPTRSTPVAA